MEIVACSFLSRVPVGQKEHRVDGHKGWAVERGSPLLIGVGLAPFQDIF